MLKQSILLVALAAPLPALAQAKQATTPMTPVASARSL